MMLHLTLENGVIRGKLYSLAQLDALNAASQEQFGHEIMPFDSINFGHAAITRESVESGQNLVCIHISIEPPDEEEGFADFLMFALKVCA